MLRKRVLAEADTAHHARRIPVVYISCIERAFPGHATRLAFGDLVSDFLLDQVRGLPTMIGFFSKQWEDYFERLFSAVGVPPGSGKI